MRLSEAIRAVRGTTSQQVFATRIGAGIATLQRWEAGVGSPKHYRHVEALVAEGVPLELLVPDAAEAVAR
jgi:hypothetical protein